MATFFIEKDAQANLDYEIDWTAWLTGGETILTSTWSADTGITIGTATFGTATTTIWVSGGSLGEVYNVTNHIETTSDREDDRSIQFTIVEK